MKKFILIILIVLGVLIMLKPVSAIIKDSIGNIMYRGNVVTGIVAKDNGNKSYDCYISESEVAYPKIFTLSANPNLAVGDKVRILYKGGCKELPIILPPSTASVTTFNGYVLITAYPNALKLFDMDGTLIKELLGGGWSYGGCAITMDAQGNIYLIHYNVLTKYDNELSEVATVGLAPGCDWFETCEVGPDNFLYTLEGTSNEYHLVKRNLSDLSIVSQVETDIEEAYTYTGGMCFDSDGYWYCYKLDGTKIDKLDTSGNIVATLDMPNFYGYYAGCAVVGNNLYFSKTSSIMYYIPLSLSGYTEWSPGSAICYGVASSGGYLILTGWDGDGDGATSKYDSGRNLIWTKKLDPITSYGYKAGGYNF